MTSDKVTLETRDDLAWLPPGSTARLVISNDLPPRELVTSAFVLAFETDALLMSYMNVDGRGWNPPGGHCEPDESPVATATREAWEEACAIVTDVEPFGFQHIRLADAAKAGPYPHPDSYQLFFLAGVVRLEPFAATDEIVDRALFAPSGARRVRWVREHRPFYERALAISRRSRTRAARRSTRS